MAGAMHSPMAGDIHVSLARTISKAAASRGPSLDKAHAALLDNLDETEEPETTSLFSGRAGKRVSAFACTVSISEALQYCDGAQGNSSTASSWHFSACVEVL